MKVINERGRSNGDLKYKGKETEKDRDRDQRKHFTREFGLSLSFVSVIHPSLNMMRLLLLALLRLLLLLLILSFATALGSNTSAGDATVPAFLQPLNRRITLFTIESEPVGAAMPSLISSFESGIPSE